MFDISFSELLVIAVVALLVIGPEKLPKVARTAGALVGRMQRYMAQIKEEVGREARFEELQKLQQEIQNSAQHTQQSIMETFAESEVVASKNTSAPSSPKPKKSTKKSAVAEKRDALDSAKNRHSKIVKSRAK